MYKNFFASYNQVRTPQFDIQQYNIPELDIALEDYNLPSQQFVENYIKENTKAQEEPKTKVPESSKEANITRAKNIVYRGKNQWVKDLTQAYKKAGITNDNALKMLIAQDALESAWGKSAQGNFNYGNLTPGSSWKGAVVNGRDKDSKGNSISAKFRSYNSIDEYAADKVQFLQKLYDFNQEDSIQQFANKLQGGNKGKRRYAASPTYISAIINTYNKI